MCPHNATPCSNFVYHADGRGRGLHINRRRVKPIEYHGISTKEHGALTKEDGVYHLRFDNHQQTESQHHK